MSTTRPAPDAGIGSSAVGSLEGEHRLDEGGVGEGLRVVAEVLAGGGVHLFAEEAERSAEREELVEQRLGLAMRPVRARAWTSQNEQGRNAPSPPARPSVPGG